MGGGRTPQERTGESDIAFSRIIESPNRINGKGGNPNNFAWDCLYSGNPAVRGKKKVRKPLDSTNDQKKSRFQ